MIAFWATCSGRPLFNCRRLALVFRYRRHRYGIPPKLASTLRESLPEYVAVARVAIETRKDPDRPMSHHGFAAAVLLFSVTDALGFYFRRSTTFTVQVDGKSCSIDGEGFKHFLVLNSAFYQQTLTEPQLKALYECYRCPLSHNSSLVPGVVIEKGVRGDGSPVFYPHPIDDNSIVCVNLTGFLDLTESAVSKFLRDADQIVSGSHQETVAHLKAR